MEQHESLKFVRLGSLAAQGVQNDLHDSMYGVYAQWVTDIHVANCILLMGSIRNPQDSGIVNCSPVTTIESGILLLGCCSTQLKLALRISRIQPTV